MVAFFTPIGWGSAAVVPLTLSFIDSAVSNSNTCALPGGAQAGDWAIFFDVGFDTGAPSKVVPTNWTEIPSAGTSNGALGGGTGGRGVVSERILSAGDISGGSVTGMNASDDAKVMFVFRPSVALVSATPSTWNAEISASNPSAQSVTGSGGTPPLILFGLAVTDSGTGAFSTESPAFDATVSTADSDMIAGYKIYNSSPADHSIDMADLGRNYLASGYVAFA